MDKIIKGKLVLPAYLTVDARELIRSVSDCQRRNKLKETSLMDVLVTSTTSQSSVG